jgi:DNA-binding CsgD family transcriptional regulator
MRLLQRRERPDELTERQREVLALLRRGLTNEEIGQELGISADGAKFHVSEILSKLQLSSRHEAASLPAGTVAPRRWWAGLAPLPLLRDLRWDWLAYGAGAAVTAAGIVAIVVLAWGVWATGGGSSVAVERDGDACAPAVREEFLRQQALVEWDVYCPSELPDGFRLARADDPPPDPPHLGADARPTIDDMHPEGRTFITRLLQDDDDAELVILQGAWSIDYGDDWEPCFECPEAPSAGAMFGDLSGQIDYELATVSAWESEPWTLATPGTNMRKLVRAHGLAEDTLLEIAGGMEPVRPRGQHLRDALLRVVDVAAALPFDGQSEWLPSGPGYPMPLEHACLHHMLPFPPSARVDIGFTGSFFPVVESFRPILKQRIGQFDVAGADAYMSAMRGLEPRCIGEAADLEWLSIEGTTLPYAGFGDDVVGFRLTVEEPQHSQVDFVAVRAGEFVSLLSWFDLRLVGHTTKDELHLLPLVELATERLEGFAQEYDPLGPVATAGPPWPEEIAHRLASATPGDDWRLHPDTVTGFRLRYPPAWEAYVDGLEARRIRLALVGDPNSSAPTANVTIQPYLEEPTSDARCARPASTTVAGHDARVCTYRYGDWHEHFWQMPTEWSIISVTLQLDDGPVYISASVRLREIPADRTVATDALIGEIVGIIASLEIDAE